MTPTTTSATARLAEVLRRGKDEVIAPLRAVQTDLNSLDQLALSEARIRSRIPWADEGGMSYTCFGVRKQNQSHNLLTEFVDENGRSCLPESL